jgi:SpoIIAA-like
MTGEGSKRQYIPADDRIQFITHQGKQILTVDLSHCSAERIEKIVREVPEVVSTRPLGSVLIFSDFTGAKFNEEAVRVMKESAVFDKPYIKKTAWVGAAHIPHELVETLKRYSGREFPTFKNREEALAWLVKD